jgi:hypothetical protein
VKQKLRSPPGAEKARSSAQDRRAESESSTLDKFTDRKPGTTVRAERLGRSSFVATGNSRLAAGNIAPVRVQRG